MFINDELSVLKLSLIRDITNSYLLKSSIKGIIMSSPEIPEIKVNTSAHYHDITMSGYWGGIRPSGMEFTVYSEMMDFAETLASQPPKASKTTIVRTIEANMKMDPLQMVSFHIWLGQKIEEYRKIVGPIPSPEEIAQHQKDLKK